MCWEANDRPWVSEEAEAERNEAWEAYWALFQRLDKEAKNAALGNVIAFTLTEPQVRTEWEHLGCPEKPEPRPGWAKGKP